MKRAVKSFILVLMLGLLMTSLFSIDANAATKSKKSSTKKATQEALAISVENGVDSETVAQYEALTAQIAQINAGLDQLKTFRAAQVKMGASEVEIAATDISINNYTATLANVNAEYAEVLAKAQKQMEDYAKVQEQYQAVLKSLADQEKQRQALLKTQKKNNKNANPVTGVILIGDSRFVQMHETMGDTGAMYLCENAKGYDWMMEKAIDVADKNVIKGTRVVFNLGVNDTRNCNKYIETVNKYAALWTARGAKVYYATVNPVWENPYTTKEQVDAFNNEIKTKLLGVNIIDTNAYLTATGCKIVDGLHYDAATYVKIYNYIMDAVVQ